jgi:hypothetical protein
MEIRVALRLQLRAGVAAESQPVPKLMHGERGGWHQRQGQRPSHQSVAIDTRPHAGLGRYREAAVTHSSHRRPASSARWECVRGVRGYERAGLQHDLRVPGERGAARGAMPTAPVDKDGDRPANRCGERRHPMRRERLSPRAKEVRQEQPRPGAHQHQPRRVYRHQSAKAPRRRSGRPIGCGAAAFRFPRARSPRGLSRTPRHGRRSGARDAAGTDGSPARSGAGGSEPPGRSDEPQQEPGWGCPNWLPVWCRTSHSLPPARPRPRPRPETRAACIASYPEHARPSRRGRSVATVTRRSAGEPRPGPPRHGPEKPAGPPWRGLVSPRRRAVKSGSRGRRRPLHHPPPCLR